MEYGDLEDSLNRPSLKINAIPSSSTCVKMFLTTLQTLTMRSWRSKFPPTTFQPPQTAITETEYQTK